MKHLFIILIQIYRYTLSPLIAFVSGGQVCRFEPTCSLYAIESLKTHGALRGSWLAMKRICRCHPWGDSGLDPVPPKRKETEGACSNAKSNQTIAKASPRR